MKNIGDSFFFNLNEAREELDGLISDLQRNPDLVDNALVMSRYCEIFWHLSAAWNGRAFDITDLNKLSPEEFRMLGNRLPNLVYPFVLDK
jgi:hypothetical protein